MIEPDGLLFVYGTLRPGFDGPMARWLRGVARPIRPGEVRGILYKIADYPGLVAGEGGRVIGDLFALPDPAAILARLDDYEQCASYCPEPHEYRRARIGVTTPDGPVVAWTYIYALDVTGLSRISGGDYLA
jgi:gamma-glutamylcyclotransferase (GGCT)/AIG2-like uncharacterized protein YtfP